MAPIKPISVHRVDLRTSVARWVHAVELFNGRGPEAKAREVVLTCAFEVFVVWLWTLLLCRFVVIVTVFNDALYRGAVFHLLNGDCVPIVPTMLDAIGSSNVLPAAF